MTEEQKKMIHREMTIDVILSSYPQKAQKLAQALTDAGLHCVGCQASTWETLEVGMKGHGMSDETIDALIKKLNAILEEETDLTTITLTPRAAKKFLDLAQADNKQGFGIRFTEVPAGCSGFEYQLDFSEKTDPEKDVVFVSQDVELHVSKTQVASLLGSEIDYVDGLQGAGFKVTNPNVRSSCGCGSSHGY